jgi:hypothetical protein
MSDTVWVERRPFQTHGRAIGDDGDDGVVIFDPTCTPDHLLIPNDESIPPHLRGERLLVEHAVRLESCPCGFKNGGTEFAEHMAQYHLMKGGSNLSVVGCSLNNEWITVMLDDGRAHCLRQISRLMGNKVQK